MWLIVPRNASLMWYINMAVLNIHSHLHQAQNWIYSSLVPGRLVFTEHLGTRLGLPSHLVARTG